MEQFYKITKAEADLLGRFEYAPNQVFDPYCSEQKDGTFVVSEIMYARLQAHPKFVSVNFNVKQKIDQVTITTESKEAQNTPK